jgi:hypothetical protein
MLIDVEFLNIIHLAEIIKKIIIREFIGSR